MTKQSNYTDYILQINDIEMLTALALQGQELNNKLHRRLQKCEGADLRLETMKSNLQNQLNDYIKMSDQRNNRWASKYSNLRHKVDELPFYIKWVFKL